MNAPADDWNDARAIVPPEGQTVIGAWEFEPWTAPVVRRGSRWYSADGEDAYPAPTHWRDLDETKDS